MSNPDSKIMEIMELFRQLAPEQKRQFIALVRAMSATGPKENPSDRESSP